MLARLVAAAALILLHPLASGPVLAANCEVDSTGLVPLTDLGAGTYQGYLGGLYESGSNIRPPAHEAAGLAIAQSIVPLDTLGQPDPGGRVVLISIGMSNATQEFSQFVPKAMNLAGRNPALHVVDCAQGGQTASIIRNPGATFWSVADQRLRNAGSAPAQVQVAWIKEANAGPSGGFVTAASRLTDDLAAVVRVLKDRYPNVRLAYLTSRIYAGYATTALNPEPYAYESGFAVRWLIEQQLAGVDSLEFDPGEGAVESPWLAWGPYLWADGLEGRGDGLVWPCDYFSANDGTHPAAGGRALVSDSLLAFFSRDATTVPWFMEPAPVSVAPRGDELVLALAPNPAAGAVEARFTLPAGTPWRLDVLDVQGRLVRALGHGTGLGSAQVAPWDGRHDAGGHASAGVYWMRLVTPAGVATRRLAWLVN
jgi:hypothetical protein